MKKRRSFGFNGMKTSTSGHISSGNHSPGHRLRKSWRGTLFPTRSDIRSRAKRFDVSSRIFSGDDFAHSI